jgi:hypothetical protein
LHRARRLALAGGERQPALHRRTPRPFPAERLGHEPVVFARQVAADRCEDTGCGAEAKWECLLHAHLRHAQVQVARSEERRKRERGQRCRIVRRHDHMVLPDRDSRAGVFDLGERHQQTRQAHHLPRREAWNPAEKV